MKQLTIPALSGKGVLRHCITGIIMLLLWTVSNEAWAQTTSGSTCFTGTNNPVQVSAQSVWTINPI